MSPAARARRPALVGGLLAVLLAACGTAPAAQAPGPHSGPTVSPAASAAARPTLPPQLGSSTAGLGALSRRAGRTPIGVRVGAVGLSGQVSPVGLGRDGTLGVPLDNTTVGWWQDGALPGDPGVSLLAAHVDYSGRKGVFFRLDSVRPGDLVVLDLAAGGTQTWRVTRRRQTPKQQLPVRDLTRSTGAPELVLVTCGGSFDAAKHSYRDNVLVWATRVR